MAFLLPIPITLVLGLLWASWVSRPRRPADPTTTVEQWARTVQVLASPVDTAPADRGARELARSA